MSSQFPFHREATVRVAAKPEAVFALLDDPQRLGAHMEKPSLMMAGATMKIETDSNKGKALGSVITLKGRVLGMALSVSEKVTDYAPPLRKSWETFGETHLLVVGAYRMGFVLTPDAGSSTLRVWIDYDWPAGRWARLLGKLLGRLYADWCVQRMAIDAVRAF
ncbi:Polyketide cyclase / dehydrase and lipid transport [Polaromonas sp. CF318]|uniref:SRPBCC family protein n=1 Tax=Polaromonas sp. CF318 TaxID=1144318 RepID=UPI0002713513|nr:SRPBCC family protein [Polaromonas sp. CF318]EJL89861.1 Polyketide cyclase / dehydrase and lipid transport [Polaromonas sp. CF318]